MDRFRCYLRRKQLQCFTHKRMSNKHALLQTYLLMSTKKCSVVLGPELFRTIALQILSASAASENRGDVDEKAGYF